MKRAHFSGGKDKRASDGHGVIAAKEMQANTMRLLQEPSLRDRSSSILRIQICLYAVEIILTLVFSFFLLRTDSDRSPSCADSKSYA